MRSAHSSIATAAGCLALLVALLAAPGVAGAQAAAAKGDPLAMRSKGAATAPVTVYEMSDYQCPYCRRHALETFPAIERDYIRTGKVRWVFVNLPITEIHANAVAAAELAMCAGRQGKFWPAHDLIFRHQAAWAPLRDPGPFFVSFADSLALKREPLIQCLRDPATRREIEADADGSIRAGARSTPTFYIEGGLVVGAQPIEVFRAALDSIGAAKAARR